MIISSHCRCLTQRRSAIKRFDLNLDIQVLSEHTAMATGVRFGERANYIGSTSMDRTLKIYAE